MFSVYAFDLGNVIIPFDHSGIATELIKYSAKGNQFSSKDIHNHLYRTKEIEHLYEEGKITTAEFIKNVKETFYLEISDERFREIFCNIFFDAYPKTVEIIKAIKKKNRPLILISNTNEMHFEYIRKKYEVIEYFDTFLLSYKAGARKPDIRIYKELIKISGCSPEKIFYTDDIEEYIKSAERLGISAFHFTTPIHLSEYLNKCQVLC